MGLLQGFVKFWLLFTCLVLGFSLFLEWNFPENLKDIKAQKFQSHPARQLTSQVRDFMELNPDIYIGTIDNTIIGICQDVQIDKKDIAYCVNDRNFIISIDTKTKKVTKLGQLSKGKSYGIKLSRDQKLLYIINSQLGLVEFNLQTRKSQILVSQYEGEFLISLDAIQTHPQNPDLIYITQASTRVPLSIYPIDLILNNPFGRLFQFNKANRILTLVTDGLYFANGIVFQHYNDQQTVLVAETNRFRLIRIYLSGKYRGQKQVAIDQLDFYIDNVKQNQKGQLWVAGPSARSNLLAYADHHPWVRIIISRLPKSLFSLVKQKKFFGGMKISFSQDKQKFKIERYIWQSLPQFSVSTTLHERNNKLYISSLESEGILVVDKINEKLKRNKPKSTKTANQTSDL